MGVKLKGSLDAVKEKVPGPGSYAQDSTKLKTSAPHYGFGSSKRPDITGKKNSMPGPGEYKIPVKISDSKDFALHERQHEYRYVWTNYTSSKPSTR